MNLKDAFVSLGNYFSPKIIGEVNYQHIKVVKIKGQEVPWHNHKNEDENNLIELYSDLEIHII
jgi:quercetin dioxygenase-like cupin family protein